jgi:tRNA pseudouridine38-40 synthase
MARFKMYLEYEGTRFSGWQVQKNARTVQGELMTAFRTVFDTNQFEFMGSGRTDAGVHAIEQVAHLDVQTMLGPEIIRMKVNDELPADINVIEVEKAAKNFHARHDAVARSYLYQISRRRTAFGKRYVWWIKDKLDLHVMKEAADLFSGMHDFRSFTADDPEEKSTKVMMEAIEVAARGDLILIRFCGSHFIWKMIRQMVGVMAEVGRKKMTLETVKKYLVQHSGEPAKFTAPPSGLFLERIYYSKEREKEIEPMMPISNAWRV